MPRTVLKLAIRPCTLLITEYLVADAYLAVKDLFIALPVFRHFGVNKKTLIEDRRDLQDGIS